MGDISIVDRLQREHNKQLQRLEQLGARVDDLARAVARLNTEVVQLRARLDATHGGDETGSRALVWAVPGTAYAEETA